MELDKSRVERAVAQAKEWSEAARAYPTSSAKLLSQVLDHAGGLDYTVSFVDGVIRPEDPAISAHNLKSLAERDASFLPWYLGLPAKIGGRIAPMAPGLATPAAERVFAATSSST